MKSASGAAQVDLADRIRIEQIRLIYAMDGTTITPSLVIAVLMFLALRNDANMAGITVWLAVFVASRIIQFFDSRAEAARPIAPKDIAYHHRKLMLVHGFDAASWAVLVWIVLDHASPNQAILLIAVLTGFIGGAVSLLSPVPRVLASFVAVDLLVLVTKFLAMRDPTYNALAAMTVVYLASVVMQGRDAYLATKQSILLKFENLDLTASLAKEVERANAAHREAVAAGEAKLRFLAAASHDLRQPIHAVGLFLAAIDSEIVAHKRERIVAGARAATATCTTMLNALLDFSRVEAGAITPESRSFALQEMLERIELELAPLADEKQLIYRSRPTQLWVRSDPALVELVLRNLITNAIRYTHSGGVLVGARQRSGRIWLEVWDTGIGIAEDQQSEIFRDFYRVDGADNERLGGVGLGLAIASRLAAALGEQLLVRSHLGKGSVFRLSLPEAENKKTAIGSGPQLSRPTSQPTADRSRVLFLDDDPNVREAVGALLCGWGFSVDLASDIASAASLFGHHQHSVFISDYRLGGDENGVDAIVRLQGMAANRDLKCLLITGDTTPDRLHEFERLEVPVLYKPVDETTLRAALEID